MRTAFMVGIVLSLAALTTTPASAPCENTTTHRFSVQAGAETATIRTENWNVADQNREPPPGAGGARPRWSHAAGVATRPLGVRSSRPCWMRNGS